MDGRMDWMYWIMLSRGLKPRCRSEYLGQLDWSDARAAGCHHVPPLAAAERLDGLMAGWLDGLDIC